MQVESQISAYSNPDNHDKVVEGKGFEIIYSPSSILVQGWSLTRDVELEHLLLKKHIIEHFEKKDRLQITFKYELFNSSTLRHIFSIIKCLNALHKMGKKIKVNWMCSGRTEEMIDVGLDMLNLCEFPFEVNYNRY